MALFALTTLSLLIGFPQDLAGKPQGDPDPRLKSVLGKSDMSSLNKKAQDWIPSIIEWENATKGASKARKSHDRAKAKFMKVFDSKSKKAPLLANVGDLLGIFNNSFEYKRESTSGEIKKISKKGSDFVYNYLAPKRYDQRKSYPSVVILPGLNDKKSWEDPRDYMAAAWKGTPSYADTIFVSPEMLESDYEAKPDLTTSTGSADEIDRIRGVLGVFGEIQRKFRLDRRRMFLDCGVGNGAFGLRLATYFPDRFSGLILRAPVLSGDLSLESMGGVPVLLVSTAETAATCDKIQKALDAVEPGFVTIVEGSGAAPYTAAAGEIDAWMRTKSRNLFPKEVVIVPNHDRFQSAHWVQIIASEPLESVGKDERPFVRVKSDPDNNRVIITTRSVSEMGLYLNDCFVDLSKEVVFVVNGQEIKGNQFQRSMKVLTQYMIRRYDPTFLYTAYHRFEVPSVPKDDKGK
jgi:hypothetical protein